MDKEILASLRKTLDEIERLRMRPTEAEPLRKPVTSTPCPVCGFPIRSDEDYDLVDCTRCAAILHGACFWRSLPLEEWVAYLRWVKESDWDEIGLGRAMVCATCRKLEGLTT
jgi:hypothetical protein